MVCRAMAFARRKVGETWKRLKVTGVGKTIAGAKIKSNHGTNEKPQMKKLIKIKLIDVFSVNLMRLLHLEVNKDRLFGSIS